jgi:hypothetical protein
MKNIIVIGVIIILATAGYLIGTGFQSNESDVTQDSSDSRDQNGISRGEDRNVDPSSRVRGRVMSITDTEIVVGTFAQRQGTDGGVDRAQIQDMSEQEREAFRAQRQAERGTQEEPEITGEKVITITNETTFTKGGGFGPGGQRGGGRRQVEDESETATENTRPEPEQIEQSTIEEGMIISATLKDGTQEAEVISIQGEE